MCYLNFKKTVWFNRLSEISCFFWKNNITMRSKLSGLNFCKEPMDQLHICQLCTNYCYVNSVFYIIFDNTFYVFLSWQLCASTRHSWAVFVKRSQQFYQSSQLKLNRINYIILILCCIIWWKSKKSNNSFSTRDGGL